MQLYVFPQRFQVRGGLTEDLDARNEVLLERELCFAFNADGTVYGFKAGDGSTRWLDLEYIAVGGDTPVTDTSMPAVMARISMRF